MKLKHLLLAAGTITAAAFLPAQVEAQEELGFTRSTDFSIFYPAQVGSEFDSVDGVRFNIFYAKNNNLRGLDLGLLGVGQWTGDVQGVQLNVLGSIVEGDMTGWQTGLYTQTDGEFTGVKGGFINLQGDDLVGWQYGAISLADSEVAGLQTGLFNKAGSVNGVQLGLINFTDQLYGLQIGLLNFNVEADPLYVFPIVNFSF